MVQPRVHDDAYRTLRLTSASSAWTYTRNVFRRVVRELSKFRKHCRGVVVDQDILGVHQLSILDACGKVSTGLERSDAPV